MANDLFRYHTDNLHTVGDVLERTLSLIREAIREQDVEAEQDLTLSAALLLGMKLETRLAQIIWEPGGFSDEERSEITENRSQSRRWSSAIDIGFRRRHNTWYLDHESIGSVASERRLKLRQAFTQHLEPVIRMRNTLAHGQWVHPLNSKGTGKNHQMEKAIRSESALSISIIDRLAHHHCQLLGDLVSTAVAFERDFSKTYEKFEQALQALESSDLSQYRQGLVDRHLRGVRARQGGLKPSFLELGACTTESMN